MSEIRAEYLPRPDRGGRGPKPGAVIRIGSRADAGAGVSAGPAALWLTVAEAERLARELLAALELARAAAPQPEPQPREDSPHVPRD